MRQRKAKKKSSRRRATSTHNIRPYDGGPTSVVYTSHLAAAGSGGPNSHEGGLAFVVVPRVPHAFGSGRDDDAGDHGGLHDGGLVNLAEDWLRYVFRRRRGRHLGHDRTAVVRPVASGHLDGAGRGADPLPPFAAAAQATAAAQAPDDRDGAEEKKHDPKNPPNPQTHPNGQKDQYARDDPQASAARRVHAPALCLVAIRTAALPAPRHRAALAAALFEVLRLSHGRSVMKNNCREESSCPACSCARNTERAADLLVRATYLCS